MLSHHLSLLYGINYRRRSALPSWMVTNWYALIKWTREIKAHFVPHLLQHLLEKQPLADCSPRELMMNTGRPLCTVLRQTWQLQHSSIDMSGAKQTTFSLGQPLSFAQRKSRS